MPRVNIYIRDEDKEAWESIRNKPTFIHNAIAMREDYLALSPKEKKVVKEEISKIPQKISTFNTPKEVRQKLESREDVKFIPKSYSARKGGRK